MNIQGRNPGSGFYKLERIEFRDEDTRLFLAPGSSLVRHVDRRVRITHPADKKFLPGRNRQTVRYDGSGQRACRKEDSDWSRFS